MPPDLGAETAGATGAAAGATADLAAGAGAAAFGDEEPAEAVLTVE